MMDMNGSPEDGVTVDRLIDDFRLVFRDTETLVKASAGDLGDKAREARERLKVRLKSVRKGFRQFENRALEGVRATDRAIRKHPVQSVCTAFGVGLVIGLLMRR